MSTLEIHLTHNERVTITDSGFTSLRELRERMDGSEWLELKKPDGTGVLINKAHILTIALDA